MMKTRIKAKGNKKQQKKRIILTSLAVGAAGILGYFGWQYFNKKKQSKTGPDLDEILKSSAVTAASPGSMKEAINIPTPKIKPAVFKTTNPVQEASDFPLQKGSKGENVRLVQQALIAKYGKSILPKYGADGDFGTETINALKGKGLPTT